MLVGQELYSSPRYKDSFMDIIKQTILKQDLMFRMQVHELHRLYQVQKILSKDAHSKELLELSPCNAKPQSSACYFEHDCQYGSLPCETKSSLTNKIVSTNAGAQEVADKPFDLRLSADEFISNVNLDCPGNQKKSNLKGKPLVSAHCLSGSNSLGEEDLCLLQKGKGVSKARLEKENGPRHRNENNLDDSGWDMSCNHGNFYLKYATRYQDEAGMFDHLNLVNKQEALFDEFVEFSSFKESNQFCQEESFSRKGNNEFYDGIAHTRPLPQIRKPSTAEGRYLDLNEPFIDDSSHDSNAPMSEYSSVITPADFTAPLTASRNCQVQSALPFEKSKDIYDNPSQSPCRAKVKNNQFSESKHIGSCCDYLQHKFCSSGSISSEKNKGENTTVSCVSCPKSKILAGNCQNSLFTGPPCSSDDHSSTSKSIRSNQQPISLNPLFSNLRSKDMHFPGWHGTLAAKHDESTKKKVDLMEESSEVLQRAAESLIHLSNAKCPILDTNLEWKPMIDESEKEIDENPQLSSDSFEHIVLKLTEDNVGDEAVSSKSPQCNDIGANDNNTCKMRRGRRLKNFQKEILPSIVSLAVQEIREDINIMEGVLRSREYRKRRAKMAVQDHGWCIVKQRRRSRLQHVRRRIFT